MKLSRPAKKSPLVSITPLIDVVFILLIFFMLVSQFSQWQKQVIPLSQQRSVDAQLVIEIKLLDHQLFEIDNQLLDYSQLTSSLMIDKNRPILLLPQSQIPLQHFINIKDKLSLLGITKISSEFETDEITKK